MDQFDFRGTPQAKRGLDLSQFIDSSLKSEALAVGTADKQMEIDALLERARIHEEGATLRERETRASQEAIHKATNDTNLNIHAKDIIPAEKLQAINQNRGVELFPPGVDLPTAAVVNILNNWESEQRTASRERVAAAAAKYSADKHFDSVTAQIAHWKEQAAKETTRQNLANTKFDQGVAEKRQTEALNSLETQIKGALNINAHPKTGLNQQFDPGQAFLDNPEGAELMRKQIEATGGLPKGAPVTPIRSYNSYNPSHWYSLQDAEERKTQETNLNTFKTKWEQSIKIAPPTTGSGGASMNKGALKGTLDPLSPTSPTPAATQLIPTPTPSAMGGFPSKVGAQPALTAPGPSAGGPPSSQSPGPDYRLQQTDKGAKSWFNPKTGDRQLISGAQ
jgi:hypothetical protein